MSARTTVPRSPTFEDKIGRIAEIRKNVRSFPDESGEVATDYSRIQAKFILKDDNKILLSLPEIRLEGEKSKPDVFQRCFV